MTRIKACKNCPFKRNNFQSQRLDILNFILRTLHVQKGNFACHEDASIYNLPITELRKIMPHINSCVGYQNLLAKRSPRIFFQKLIASAWEQSSFDKLYRNIIKSLPQKKVD